MRAIALFSVALTLLAGAAGAQGVDIQSLGLDFGEGSVAGRSVQLLVMVTLISLVPALAIMFTSFPFMVTVLSILRQGLGTQQSPPNMLIVTLALFLTWYVMAPVFDEAWANGIAPLLEDRLPVDAALRAAMAPFQTFMSGRVDPTTYQTMASLRPDTVGVAVTDAPLSTLVPSFLLSELSRAFQIGFLIFLPFLIIDLVVAAVLMSMGMMMVPPAVVALPFKLAFFVVADGWSLIASSLVRNYF